MSRIIYRDFIFSVIVILSIFWPKSNCISSLLVESRINSIFFKILFFSKIKILYAHCRDYKNVIQYWNRFKNGRMPCIDHRFFRKKFNPYLGYETSIKFKITFLTYKKLKFQWFAPLPPWSFVGAYNKWNWKWGIKFELNCSYN